MNTCRQFEKPTSFFTHAEFYDFRTDNFLRVERILGQLVVRTMRDVPSEDERNYFLRRLALEGFIADQYRWPRQSYCLPADEVDWVTDVSWIGLGHQLKRLVARFWRPFLATTTLFSAMGLLAWCGFQLVDREHALIQQHLMASSPARNTSAISVP